MYSKPSTSINKNDINQQRMLKERLFDIDMALDILIKYLILVLEDPTTDAVPAQQGGETLAESVNLLVMGYPFFGIAPDLTLSEIEIGLENAYDIVDLLDKSRSEIGLDFETQDDLRETVESIIEDLIDDE
tara:strand:+ start:965 stop:1357 length:393 start_codon:yes stop_codon:yes gene_type:complete